MVDTGPWDRKVAVGSVADEYFSRERQIQRLRRERFDAAVIGGGINGAAVARDAAMRGLRVALIDRGDFAGQTSSRSTKLIHGGLRYLPQGQLHLVYEALRERELLTNLTAPHLVRPIELLFPVYAGAAVSRVALWAGLLVYDLLARTPRIHRHRALSAAQVAAMEPELNRAGLRGGAIYYDSHGDDSRLTLENALDAAMHGAAAANYIALEGFEKRGGKLCSAQVKDVLSGEAFTIEARLFVNAAGPWIDHVRRMDDPATEAAVRLTKGVHLVLDSRRLALRHSLVLSAGAGRIVFLIRDRDSILLGTTDTDFGGDPASVHAEAGDVEYLIDVVQRFIPDAALRPRDAIASFAGVRTLIAGDGSVAPSRVPREELIIPGKTGMLSIAGGKLTTHRRIAQRVVDMIARELGMPVKTSPTLTTPLPGARPLSASGATGAPGVKADRIEPAACAELAARYGSRAALLEHLIEQRPELAEPLCADCPVLAVEAVYAARFEMALTLEDFLVRRTAIARRATADVTSIAQRAAHLMGSELGWSPQRELAEAAQFGAAPGASRKL